MSMFLFSDKSPTPINENELGGKRQQMEVAYIYTSMAFAVFMHLSCSNLLIPPFFIKWCIFIKPNNAY